MKELQGQGSDRQHDTAPAAKSRTLSVAQADVLHPVLRLQRMVGNRAVQQLLSAGIGSFTGQVRIQPKLSISSPDDVYEQEAERVADAVMSMPERASASGTPSPAHGIQRLCQECEEEKNQIHRSAYGASAAEGSDYVESQMAGLSGGAPLPDRERNFFEPRFGHDFSAVRIHTGSQAAELARSVNAHAFTLGNRIVFNSDQYLPETDHGRRLLAHELTHVVQQSGAVGDRASVLAPLARLQIQRTLGDGHDLTSPRFSHLLDLEAAYDGETVIRVGSPSGRGVQAIQQALYDLGFTLPTFGADGNYGTETVAAVRAFQSAHPPLSVDGEVGQNTMTALNARFAAPVLPAAAARSAAWTPACVRSVICQWSPHTIDVLRTRITLKSFDSISWADEQWNGAAWIPAPFPGAGYNTGTEIGVLNSSCEEMAETLYHEVLHAEQPTTQRTTLEKESYAYRIGEEFSIAMGLGGRPALRTTDAQGRQFADPARVGASVATDYPSVPAGGGGDEIIRRAVALGDVVVRRPNGTTYTRAAAVGEKVPGPITIVNQVLHAAAAWTCP